MPLSKTAFLRSTSLLLLAGLATLLVIVGATLWLTFKTEKNAEQVYEGRRIRSALMELRGILQDAETGQRGYLLSRENSYLDPYRAAQDRLGESLRALRSELGARADASVLARLEASVAGKLAELDETVELAKTGRLDEALAIVRGGRGRALMDEARSIFDDLLGRADAGLDRSMREQQASIAALKWANLLGALLIVLVVGSSAWIAANYTADLASARAELASANLGLEQRVADRTAALGRANDEMQRFTYIVGHDLRSPLFNIMGFTSEVEMLAREAVARLAKLRGPAPSGSAPPDDDLTRDFGEAVGFIRTSVGRMDGLVTAILKMARDGTRVFVPERLDMAALLGGAAATVQHRVAERGGRIELPGRCPAVTSDRLAIEQVFGNLLDNAVKYTAPDRAPMIVISVRETPDAAEFSVADNGRGIAPADQERVFELFGRAGRPDQPGEGIGLSTVRALVRRLGGEITLTSVLGSGTTFVVTLPKVLPGPDHAPR